jgi:hypothetical protein
MSAVLLKFPPRFSAKSIGPVHPVQKPSLIGISDERAKSLQDRYGTDWFNQYQLRLMEARGILPGVCEQVAAPIDWLRYE